MKPKDEAHINELLQQHKVRRIGELEAGFMNLLRGRYGMPDNSFTATNRLTGESVMFLDEGEADDNGSYFIAMHEMGHAVLGHNKGEKEKDSEERVDREIAAWEWALANAKSQPTESTLLMIMDAVGTYTDNLAKLRSPERTKRGVEAIIYLQGMAGMTETEESALASWKVLREEAQEFTLILHRMTLKAPPWVLAQATLKARASGRVSWDERLK